MTNHEWIYYIGGSCGFKNRGTRKVDARIEHRDQDVYEALIVRRNNGEVSGYFPLGIFNNTTDAESVIEKAYGYD